MNLQKLAIPVLAVILVAAAYRGWGWPGVALVTGALVMWVMLHFTRLVQVLKRAADRPVGYVGSAVMLNAKLRPRFNLMHVVAMTRALGELRSPKDEQPEVYRWTDGSASFVDCEFRHGKLVKWTLTRPAPAEDADPPDAPVAAPALEAASAATPAAGPPAATPSP